MIIGGNERLRFERSCAPLPRDAEEVAVFWWHDESNSDRLSDNNAMGLRTAVAIGGLSANLFSYQRPDNLPEGVTWQDASQIMPHDEYKAI